MEIEKHSGVGITSFITSTVFALLALASVLAADKLAMPALVRIDEKSLTAIMLGLSLAGSLVALRLGVGGILQEGRRKIFAVLGIVLSAATILGIGLIMAISLAPK